MNSTSEVDVNLVSAQSVREAVAGGDYARALCLWQQYTAAMAAAKPTKESLAEAAELIEWARPLLKAACADAADCLRALHVAGAYGSNRQGRYKPLVRESF